MSNNKKAKSKKFTNIDELKATLFPDMDVEPEVLAIKTKELDEADILANKLVDSLMSNMGQKSQL